MALKRTKGWMRPKADASTEGFVQLGRGARLDGKLEGTGTVLIHGELTGEIALDGELLVGLEGRVRELKGRTQRLRVEGRASGQLKVEGPIEVAETGFLEGEIESPRLDASPGARIEATLRIGSNS